MLKEEICFRTSRAKELFITTFRFTCRVFDAKIVKLFYQKSVSSNSTEFRCAGIVVRAKLAGFDRPCFFVDRRLGEKTQNKLNREKYWHCRRRWSLKMKNKSKIIRKTTSLAENRWPNKETCEIRRINENFDDKATNWCFRVLNDRRRVFLSKTKEILKNSNQRKKRLQFSIKFDENKSTFVEPEIGRCRWILFLLQKIIYKEKKAPRWDFFKREENRRFSVLFRFSS